MKIKTKKTMNLPQLVEWAWDNPELIEGKIYLTKEHDRYSPYVQFSVDGYGVRTSQSISKDDTFTVEIEEEIKEDTVIPKMLLKGRYTGYYEVEDCKLRGFNENLLQAYIINDDLTMTLIWRDGKLVE